MSNHLLHIGTNAVIEDDVINQAFFSQVDENYTLPTAVSDSNIVRNRNTRFIKRTQSQIKGVHFIKKNEDLLLSALKRSSICGSVQRTTNSKYDFMPSSEKIKIFARMRPNSLYSGGKKVK